MLKIIGGQYQGRKIPTLTSTKYRPTSAKFKESLFSILSSGDFADKNIFANSKILDLYAGTGSFGIESLSRGASNITFVDLEMSALNLIKDFIETISPKAEIKFLNLDAANLPYSSYQYDLVFLDPPYYKNLASGSLKTLISKKWIKDKAIIIIELATVDNIVYDELSYQILDQRIYGGSKLIILKYEQQK